MCVRFGDTATLKGTEVYLRFDSKIDYGRLTVYAEVANRPQEVYWFEGLVQMQLWPVLLLRLASRRGKFKFKYLQLDDLDLSDRL